VKQSSKQGKTEAAIEDYSESIRLDPKDPEAPYNRGLAYLRVEKYEYAARDFSEVIRIQPRNAEAHVYRGLARLYQGKEKEGDADFQKAFQLSPGLKKKIQPVIDEAKAKTKGSPKE
jgi:tetratricopeptide (TPR) repeat protein